MADDHVKPKRGSFKDLEGLPPFGRWTVISFCGSVGGNGGAKWLCKCNCGTVRAVKAASLLSGRSYSCGCYRSDRRRGMVGPKDTPASIKSIHDHELADDGLLPCSKCRQRKPDNEFRLRPGRSQRGKRRGRWSHCKDCERVARLLPENRKRAHARAKEFWKRLKATNPKEARRRERESNLRSKYGFGHAEFAALAERQRWLCAICGKPATKGRGKKLHIDHDHKTGRIRGLLCGPCNISLGRF